MLQRVEIYPPEVEGYRQFLLTLRDQIERQGQREFAERFNRRPMMTALERDAILRVTLDTVRPVIEELVRLMPLAKESWVITD